MRASVLFFLVVFAVLTGCGAPAPKCDQKTCPGCCSLSGQCQAGSDVQACGVGGQLCSVCSGGLSCLSGACFSTSSGAGGGFVAAGGSAAGGSAAGGSAAGGSSGGAGGGLSTGGGQGGGSTSTRVGCAGMQYTEALPTNASLGALTYSATTAQAYLLSALDLRYPHGKAVVEGGLANPISPQQSSCVTTFLSDTSSGNAVLRQASTLVHECGHFFDLGLSRGAASTYVIAPGLQRACSNGDTTTRGGRTFARSLINADQYSPMRRPCAGASSSNCDFYANTYLDGSPTNSTFESGDQGFNSLLEEANQYVNSLASAYAFRELFQSSRVSERDGILTFMWYLERYLQLARTSNPQAYATLSQDACWREAILSVWDRGWFYLTASASSASSLGINDARLRTLVETPSLLAEIDSLRALQCN